MKVIKTVAGGRYTHPRIGRIHIKIVATSKSIRARWVNGPELVVTVPPNLPLDIYEDFIDSHADMLLARRPAAFYHIGQIIDGPLADFSIRAQATLSGEMGIMYGRMKSAPQRGKAENYYVELTKELADRDPSHPATQQLIVKALIATATMAVKRLIVPRAQDLAHEHGCHPTGWTVKYNKRSFGSCNGRGTITLSPKLIFLPQELSDYVICHELAHLSEMNHSAAFHRLCNKYCGGREAELHQALNDFVFPPF